MKKLYFLILIALSSHSLFAQSIRYVKPVATGAGDGTSWDDASADLQGMINASSSSGQVWVAAGTYYPTEKIAATLSDNINSTTKRDQSFILRTGVKVYGGFAGGEMPTFNLSGRDFLANRTILSGDLGGEGQLDGDAIVTNNAYHVVTARILESGTEKSILDGFTIRDGYANGTGTVTAGLDLDQNQGAGLNLRGIAASSKIEFYNIIFQNNESTGAGGAIYFFSSGDGQSTFKNVQFLNNKSGASGGAIYITRATGDANTPGFIFENSVFSSNEAALTSGAIYYANASTGVIKILNTKFISNKSKGGVGGAIYYYSGNAEVTGSVFYDNEASTTGGAIYVSVGSSLAFKTVATIVNSTFYANKATSSGAISFFANATYAGLNLYNNIFNGNTVTGNYPDVRDDFNITSLIYKNNLFQVFSRTGARYVDNITQSNPAELFESTDPSNETDFLKLKAGSLALDKGDNSLSTALVDLANLPRIRNTTIDLGAYEFQTGNYPLPVKLESYTAIKKGSTAVLNWKTASEQNNQKFVIERGSSANDFIFFKEVAGAGDSNGLVSYSVTDFAPMVGTNYYRLTQFDKDGKSEILGTEAVSFGLLGNKAQVYPNPAKNYIEVKPSSSNGIVSLNLISLTGQNISTNNYAQTLAHESVKLDLTNVPSGTYILWINKGKSNAEKQTLLVVK